MSMPDGAGRQRAAREPAGSAVRLGAPAKLNLSLAIGPRDPDGYHQLKSLMARLDLADELVIEPRDCGGIELLVDGPAAAGVPTDRANLVWRAVELLAAEAGRTPDVRIRLTKHIPAGGGLGGGSADAAATLRGLNRLWRLGLPVEQLLPLAARLGSDVPFCLFDGPAWVSGRGERVEPLAEPLPPLWALLALPGLHVSTAAVYARLDERRAKTASDTVCARHPSGRSGKRRRTPFSPERHNQELLSHRGEIRLAGLILYNDLQEAALDVCPPLREVFGKLARLGLPGLMVAGSGSTLCAIFDSGEQARLWRQRLEPHADCPLRVASVLWRKQDGDHRSPREAD